MLFFKKIKKTSPGSAGASESFSPGGAGAGHRPPGSQRYYYPEKKLLGREFRSEIINAEVLTRLLEKERDRCSCASGVPGSDSGEIEKRFSIQDFAGGEEVFGEVAERREDIEWSSEKDAVDYCYLPMVAEFYDHGAPLTYFVAVVDGRCEIRSNPFHLGDETADNYRPWHKTIGLYGEVTDPLIIAKIERSLTAAEKVLDAKTEAYRRRIREIKEQKARRAAQNKEKFEKAARDFDAALSSLGVSETGRKSILRNALQEEDFPAALLKQLDGKQFIGYLDWKDDLEQAVHTISLVLKKQKRQPVPACSSESVPAGGEDLFCEEAVSFIQSGMKNDRLLLIDADTDGVYVTAVPAETAGDAVRQLNRVFETFSAGYSVRESGTP